MEKTISQLRLANSRSEASVESLVLENKQTKEQLSRVVSELESAVEEETRKQRASASRLTAQNDENVQVCSSLFFHCGGATMIFCILRCGP